MLAEFGLTRACKLVSASSKTVGAPPYYRLLRLSVAGKSRYRTSAVLELHMYDNGVISNDADRFKRFYLRFFCPPAHLSHGTRITSLWPYCVSLASRQLARAVSASSIRCCPPNISSVTIDHDELCELPVGRRVA